MKPASKLKTTPRREIYNIVGGIVYNVQKLFITPHLDRDNTTDPTLDMLKFVLTGIQCDGNKAFIRLGICDNVEIERSIFEYANRQKLQKIPA